MRGLQVQPGDNSPRPPSVELWLSLTAFPTIFDMTALGGSLAIAGETWQSGRSNCGCRQKTVSKED